MKGLSEQEQEGTAALLTLAAAAVVSHNGRSNNNNDNTARNLEKKAEQTTSTTKEKHHGAISAAVSNGMSNAAARSSNTSNDSEATATTAAAASAATTLRKHPPVTNNGSTGTACKSNVPLLWETASDDDRNASPVQSPANDTKTTTTSPAASSSHQDDDDDVTQAIMDLQTLKSSQESVDLGHGCSPPKRKHHRTMKELERLQVWFVSDGPSRRKRRLDDSHRHDPEDFINLHPAKRQQQQHSDEDSSSASSSSSSTTTGGSDNDDDNDNDSSKSSGSARNHIVDKMTRDGQGMPDNRAPKRRRSNDEDAKTTSMDASPPLPQRAGVVVQLVQNKYHHSVDALLADLEAQVVHTDSMTTHATAFAARQCPKGKSTIWRICCELKGHSKTDLSAWWRQRVREYKQKKGNGTVVPSSDSTTIRPQATRHETGNKSRLGDDDDKDQKPSAVPTSAQRHGHNETQGGTLCIPERVLTLPSATDSGSSSSDGNQSPILGECDITNSPNIHSHAIVTPARDEWVDSRPKIVLENIPDDMIPWKYAVALSILVFLSLCGPVALILTLYTHFYHKAPLPPFEPMVSCAAQCCTMPEDPSNLFSMESRNG